MAKSVEKPIGAIALDSRLAEEAGYSTTKPISRKKKHTRKRRHGESTENRYSAIINANYLDNIIGTSYNYTLNGSEPLNSLYAGFLFT